MPLGALVSYLSANCEVFTLFTFDMYCIVTKFTFFGYELGFRSTACNISCFIFVMCIDFVLLILWDDIFYVHLSSLSKCL